MKLSVIIPVYHVEDTLERCVNSVLQQDYDNMQIILVDDGSSDRCPMMCDKFSQQDKRITVIHQQNKGLSAARNEGIRHALGDYITFVDSDDYLDKDTYSPLMLELYNHPDYDILEYPVLIKEGSSKPEKLSLKRQSYHSLGDYWLKGRAYRHTYAWNKIYRHHLFNDISFKEGVAFEDVWTLPLLTRNATTIATTDSGCYHYCHNPNGITAQANVMEMQSLLEAHLTVLPVLWNPSEESLAYYMEILNIQLTTAEMGGDILLPPYPYQLKLSGSLTFKQKIKILLLKILGINLLCRIYKCLKRR